MSAKSFLLVLASAATATTSMVLFRKVLYGVYGWKGSLSQFFKDTLALFEKPLFLLACCVCATSILLWLVVVATQKLSIAYPLQIGLVIILTGFFSVTIFSETISIRGYIGYLLLIAGTILVSR